ncbi:MAG: 5-formyltetrahydrofolate cyclo-ligase [Betaproteobacteria bacterium]|nr:5-formyltetrahydrofolate cyclo-ligase [Betaproteobacteria bacterium]
MGEDDARDAKKRLRQLVRARRDALSDAERADLSARVCTHLLSAVLHDAPRVVLSYVSFGSELDVRAFNEAVLAASRALLLPRIDRDAGVLELYRVTDLSGQLTPGVWGIGEPDPGLCVRWQGDYPIDWALVPGVAFDRCGRRLGYGAGFYDRMLARVSVGRTVSGAFGVQVLDVVPTEPHDLGMDAVITEDGPIWTRST